MPPKVQANAGNDLLITLGQSVKIGGLSAAIDGFSPYSYATGYALSDSLIANPNANPEYCTTYMLWVTNSLGCTSFNFINVNVINNGMLLKRGEWIFP